MEELNILINYLLENNYTSTYEDALALLPSMSEAWVSSVFENYLEENYLFNYIMEMRKEDKVKGKGKTPLYLTTSGGRVTRNPEGSKTKWQLSRYNVKRMNPKAALGRLRQGNPKGVLSVAGTEPLHKINTGEFSGFVPHPHGPGGRSRGVKKERGAKTTSNWEDKSKAYKTYEKRKAQREKEARRYDNSYVSKYF